MSLRLFQYLRNMSQKPSKQIALVPVFTYIQSTSVPLSILTIPKDIFFLIVSHMGESPLALARTCRYLNDFYNKSCEYIIYTMVRDSLCKNPLIPECIKSVKYHMGQTGWKHKKVTLEIVTLAELQKNNCKGSINAWWFNEKSTQPIGLFDDANLEAILVECSDKNASFESNVSFVKFSNLTSFGLSGTTLNNDMMLKLSELPSSLKFLSMCDCIMPQGCLSQLLEGRNSLKEFQLIRSDCPSPDPIKFPPGLKRLELSHLNTSIDGFSRDRPFIVDLSLCTLIKYLIIQNSMLDVKIILSEIARLLELKLNCHLIDNEFVGESLVNLETLFIPWHYIYRYGPLRLFKTTNYGTESHPHLDLLDITSLKCLREVYILTDMKGTKFVLKVSKGSNDISIWANELQPTETQSYKRQLTEAQIFERNPEKAIEIPVTFNNTSVTKSLGPQNDGCVIS